MYYIMLYLIMLSGCATAIPMDDTMVSEVVKPISQPVQETPKPPGWILGKEHSGLVSLIKMLFLQVNQQERSCQKILDLKFNL